MTDKTALLFCESARLECPTGYNNIGGCLDVAYGNIEQDFGKCEAYFIQAFERGCILAASNLGSLYEVDGAKPHFMNNIDHEKKIQWYHKGYLCECPDSTMSLAEAYDDGEIVERDRGKALDYYWKLINICSRTSENNDAMKKAAKKLLQLICVCVLLEEPFAERATKTLKEMNISTGNSKLRDAQSCERWLICVEMKRKSPPEVTRRIATLDQKVQNQSTDLF